MSGGGSSEQTVGYRYSFGIHMGICRGPVDDMIEVRVGDRTAWVGSTGSDNSTKNIDAYNLFGGEDGEGGIQGPLDVMMGAANQGDIAGPSVSARLKAMLSNVALATASSAGTGGLPAFRGVLTLFFEGIVTMMSPYPKPWKVRVRRAVQGWDGDVFLPGYAKIIYDFVKTTGGDTSSSNPFGRALHVYPNSYNAWDISPFPASSPAMTYESRVRFNTLDMRWYGGLVIWQVKSPNGTDDSGNSLDYQQFALILGTDLRTFKVFGVEGDFVAPEALRTNVWYDIAVVIKTTPTPSTTVYLNGQSLGTVDAVNPTAMISPMLFHLGNLVNTTDAWYDEVRISKAARYSGNYTPATAPFDSDADTLLLFHFEGAVGTANVTDSSSYGRGNYGNLVGVVIESNFVANAAAANGTTQDYSQSDRSIHAMNPAHIIYECLTNRVWGRGLPRTALGPSFAKVALQLYSEQFGMCLKWTRSDTIENFVQQVLNTIAGVMYQDRTTGLLELKLIRSDYVFADLPVFDMDSGMLSIEEATVANRTDTVNEIIVSYHDPITDTDKKVRAQNIAALQAANGMFNSNTMDYVGVPVASLAMRLAQRDLRVASLSLRRFTVTLDRRGWDIYPGDVIRIRDAARNIPDMAVRVVKFEEGNLRDGRIKLAVVQDVFALPSTAIWSQQNGGFTPPPSTTCIGRYDVFELPYYFMRRVMTSADFSAVTPEASRYGALLEQGQTTNNSYDIAVKAGASNSSELPPDASYVCPLPASMVPSTVNALSYIPLTNPTVIDRSSAGNVVVAGLPGYFYLTEDVNVEADPTLINTSSAGLDITPPTGFTNDVTWVLSKNPANSPTVDSGAMTLEFFIERNGDTQAVVGSYISVSAVMTKPGPAVNNGSLAELLIVLLPDDTGGWNARVQAHTSQLPAVLPDHYGSAMALMDPPSPSGITVNTKTHVAAVYDGANGSARLYVNGLLLGSPPFVDDPYDGGVFSLMPSGVMSLHTLSVISYGRLAGDAPCLVSDVCLRDGAIYTGTSFTPPTGPLFS